MSKAKAIVYEARKSLANLAIFSANSVLVAQVFATIVFPAIELALENFVEPKPNANIWITIIIAHIAVALYAFFGLSSINNFLKATKLDELDAEIDRQKREYEAELKTNEELTAGLISLAKHSAEVQGALSILQSLLESADNKKRPLASDVGKLLAPLIQNREEILNFVNSEKYNFAVYLYNKRKGNLNLFYRDCDNRIQRHDRSWQPGVGHVGIAFAQKGTIISPDMSATAEILGADKSLIENDRSIYVSFISTPIFDSVNHEGYPLGVLVITSDRAGHLTQEYKIVTETFALLLGIYFSNIIN